MTEKEAIESYITNAILHGKYTEAGDSKNTNIAHDKLIKSYKILKKQDSSLKQLIPLLQDNDISVRAWAATHLLPIDEKLALPVLEQLSKMNSFIGLSAEMTIESWKSGTLNLDY